MTSFFEHILFQAKSQPKAPAVMTARVVVTYEELVSRVRGVIKYLSEHGVKSGQTLALNLQDPTAHCSAIIGAMASGIGTLSLGGARPRAPKNLSVDAMLCDHEVTPDKDIRLLTVAPNWLKDQQFSDVGLTPGGMHRDGVARIICTSGTTGEQKAVPFTEEQLIQRVWGQVVGLRPLAGPSKTLGMMGLASGAGFTNMMLILMTGGTLMLIPGMAQLARVSSLYRMDRVLASTAQLIGMLRQQDNDSADFTGVKSMVVGGSHIPRSVAKRARAICRNIICLYGATEVGVVATAPTELLVKHQSAVGFVAPGVTLEIVDEAGKNLGTDREGVVRVKVPGATNRYLNDDEASRGVFRDGWFYPGDIGSLSPDGLLYVSGRVSERINAGGVKVAPSVIEDVISSRPEVFDVAAFEHINAEGISEIAVAIVPHENIDRSNFNRAELRQYFQKQLREKTPRRWIIVKEIPRNEQGKIERAKLQRIAKAQLSAPRPESALA
jgi:acyl-CoA synthetase (AMP-forming)/AMP-acid ligase II